LIKAAKIDPFCGGKITKRFFLQYGCKNQYQESSKFGKFALETADLFILLEKYGNMTFCPCQTNLFLLFSV
jgi:hypothetical protein